jgi:O-methyltransferase involved in polyketide biosynthesis
MEIFLGIMIPFLGTTLGAACVFFMKKSLGDLVQRSLAGFAAGVMVAASIWSLLIPAIEQSEDMGKLSFLPAFIGFWVGVLFLLLLDRLIPHLHVGSEQAEGPKSKLGRTTMMVLAAVCGLSRGERADHGGKRTCPVPWHRHSEFSRGGDHLHAAPGGGGTQGPSISRRCAFRRCRAYRRGADASCGAACDPGAAVSAELCSGRHALCGGGGADSGNVAGTALESWNGVLCGRLQRDDGAGCGAGIGAEVLMKHKIEKNTVQETLIIPLYARKVCSELYPNLYQDETAVRLINEIDYDFSDADKNARSLMQRFGSLEVAMRQNDLAWEVRDYLKTHPNAAVVNLGCGLDSTGRSCDNGSCKIYNLDFPDVIAVRNELLPAGEREENIPCNLNDTEWFSQIDASGGAVFFASGVFYYFLTEQVKALVQKMADAFPGSVLVFDAANRTAVKMIAKTWLKSAKIKDVGAYFAISDAPQEIGAWDSRLQVTSRGYMLGYNDLRDPSVSGFFRFLARVGDGVMKMQIVRINF